MTTTLPTAPLAPLLDRLFDQADRAAGPALAGIVREECERLMHSRTKYRDGTARGATEADVSNPASLRKSEAAARARAGRGVRMATVHLARSVHGPGDHGFVPTLIRTARQTDVSAYVGDGRNCRAGVHRLALERWATAPAHHAVAHEVVPFKAMAEVIGRRLGLPMESRERRHFGGFAATASGGRSVSSVRTRERLGWQPQGPGLLADPDPPGDNAG